MWNVLFQKVVTIEQMPLTQKEIYISLKENNLSINQLLKFGNGVLDEHEEIESMLDSLNFKQDIKYDERQEQNTAIDNCKLSLCANKKKSIMYINRTVEGVTNTQLGLETLGGEEVDNKIQTGLTLNFICMVTPHKSEFELIAKIYKYRVLLS